MTFTLETDTVLGGRYRLLERVAVGGQGEVWRAEDTSLGRAAAVKVLRGEYADSAEFRDRFRMEARNAAGLSHPSVAQVFDYDEGRGGAPPYLVMEYVDGEALSATIAREAPLPPDRVLGVVVAAASALAAAHAAGIVHRDVKPGNLLLARDGSVKMADFGIARAVDTVPLTRTGTLMGTPLYLAPEQAAGMPATPASDLYALGLIAYEMLTGRPPYEGPATAVLLAHRDSPLPPLPPSVPPALADLVRALTAKDPAARPRNAAAVAAWASRLRAEPAYRAPEAATNMLAQPMPAPGPATRVLPTPVPRRRRVLPLVFGGIGIALLAGIVGWFARPTTPHRPPVTPPATAPAPAATTKPPVRRHKPPAQQPPAPPPKHGKHGGHGKHGH
jgi:eukaryotic-like serine/threonine-protein kinase